MASPFRTFRKNQKAWMVALTILTMFAFVFLGQAKMGGPSGSQTDPEVFTWKYGTVKQSDITNRMYQRKKVQEFLYRTATKADMPEQQVLQVLQSRFPVSEPRVIESILLAKKAQQMGIDISDDMVRRFIRGWTQDKVTRDDLAKIIRDLGSDRGGISQSQLFDGLRVELAAMYAQDLFSPLLVRGGQGYAWFRGDTPAERWDYFTRLNRKVTAEMMPVSVKDFVDKIPEPTAGELQSFYDQYKNDYPESTSPTPGFKQPYKVQFEYVKADNTKLLEEALGTVTEDEIQKYYDRYKDDFFKKNTLPDSPEKTDQEKAGDAKSSDAATKKGDAPATADKPGDGKADSKAGEKPADPKGSAKADASKSGANSADAKSTSKADAKSAGSKSGAKSDSKAPTKAGDAKTGDGKKSSDGKQSSDPPRGSSSSLNGELLALADDAAMLVAQKSDAAAKSDSKSAAKSDLKSNSSAGAKTNVKAIDTKADTNAPDAKTTDAKAADTKATDTKAGETKAGDSTAVGTPATQRPVEYEPFDKVSGMIRNRIAQQKVDEKVAAAFRSIQAQMERYHNNLDTYRALKSQGNTAAKQPQPPDLEALAKPFGFEVKKTELVALQQVYDSYDIGKSRQPVVAGNYSSPTFYQIAYQIGQDGQPRVKLYQTDESEDTENNNHYLWWKIADQAANIPPLDAIKSDVVTAWKLVQARKPALAKAKEDMDQVQKSKQTLKEAFGNAPGVEVLSEEPFSWLTRTADQGLRLSTIKGVENVGNDFMKDVFALKRGETGVAVNEPQTEYYVVQIRDEEPSIDALHQSFMTAMGDPMNSLVYAAVAANDHRNAPAAWFKELADQYDFKMAPGHTFSQAREID